jgi:hypothetical protein
MQPPPLPTRKRQISLRLPPELIRFADAQASQRFQTRNDYLQGLLAAAYAEQRVA